MTKKRFYWDEDVMEEQLETSESTPSAAAMLLVLILVIAGIMPNWGAFAWQGLVLILAATGLAVWMHLRPSPRLCSSESFLVGCLIAFTAAICLLQAGQNEVWPVQYIIRVGEREVPKRALNGYGLTIRLLGAVALLFSVTYLTRTASWKRIWRIRFAVLVGIGIALRILILFSTPMPEIDVFVSQTEGAKGLLEGKNVYAMEFPSPYVPGRTFNHYGYPPAAFYPAFISWVLFKDVRVGWVICDLLAGLLLYLLACRMNPHPEQKRFRELITLAFMFLPRSLFVLEQSWTEPLVAVALAGSALMMAGKENRILLGFLLGLLFSSKQYVIVVLPLLLKLKRRRITTWALAAVVCLALALPFAIWDFKALWYDVGGFFLQSQARKDALSIYAAIIRVLPPQFGAEKGFALPWVLVAGYWLAGLLFFTWKMRRSLSGWLFSTASMWLFFFMLGKQAFMNYFYVIMVALLLAVAATPQAGGQPCTPEPTSE